MIRALLTTLLATTLFTARPADACGCFAPPNPTVPVVQAGERILFSVKDGKVTAHIQVQYDGASGGEFAWLLPMPAVPTLKLGTDEVFARLESLTRPRYSMTTQIDQSCVSNFGTGGGSSSSFGGGFSGAAGGAAGGSGGPTPVVVQDSVGPYDYAVLRADSKTEMIDWLRNNRYFVPTSTEAAVNPYIRPGSYFLALKLRAGNSTGDLQPVVLEYDADVGAIPLTLTSVGATEDMPVLVWMLGNGRAIPRNYHHVVLNDAAIDWRAGGANYLGVVTRAVAEAPGKHAFVTEYAGPSSIMQNVVASPTRFGTQAELAAIQRPADFIAALYARQFASTNSAGVFALPTQLRAILARYLPPPTGVGDETFYRNYEVFVGRAPPQNFQPAMMAQEIWDRVVTPAREAQALLDSGPSLTRLFTTISPSDMNKDPVFSFNRSLPEVKREHAAVMRVSCNASFPSSTTAPAVLQTEQGWRVPYTRGRFAAPNVELSSLPAALRLEILREEGPPEVVLDNASQLNPPLEPVPSGTGSGPLASGCSVLGSNGAALLGALLLMLPGRRRRSTRSR